MKSSTILSLLSAITSQALARSIVLGHHAEAPLNPEFQALWISGENPCNDALVLADGNSNPCGRRFQIGGYEDLHFENCGSDPVQLWQTDVLISSCDFLPKEIGCISVIGNYLGEYLCHLDNE